MRSSRMRTIAVITAALCSVASVADPSPAVASRSTLLVDDTTGLDVAVPYLGAANAQLPKGWTATACPLGATPDLVSIGCEGNRITFTAADYAADLGTQTVTIGASVGGVEQSISYTVSLAPPRLAASRSFEYGYPVAQGATALIAYSDLRTDCGSCTDTGPAFTSGSVSPRAAGAVAFSGTGIIFRPAPDFSGTVEISYEIRDRYGQTSEPSMIELTVVPGRSRAPAVVDDTVSVDVGQRAYGNALTDDVQQTGVETIVIACGKPGNGAVRCEEDGSYVYTPDPGFVGIDSFSYHLFTRGTGDQVAGVVLVGVGADPIAAKDVGTGDEVIPNIHPPRPDSRRTIGMFGGLREAVEEIWGPAA
ncbi:Ig-like domain-containing protein [Plantibacter sp. Mn2098]|uniref:Ig-like domain-containing protein n=1 Tax=Plantibacter sp. Mn2098 TaxID=3395266 RepID=UPI003BDC4FB5